jgi:hypothetical protein
MRQPKWMRDGGLSPWARKARREAVKQNREAERERKKQEVLARKQLIRAKRERDRVARADAIRSKGYSAVVTISQIAYALRVGAKLRAGSQDEIWVPTWVEKARQAKIPASRVAPCICDWRQKRALLAELSLLLERTHVPDDGMARMIMADMMRNDFR